MPVICPRCGEEVAEANLRCRSCGLARQDFETYKPPSEAGSGESGGFELRADVARPSSEVPVSAGEAVGPILSNSSSEFTIGVTGDGKASSSFSDLGGGSPQAGHQSTSIDEATGSQFMIGQVAGHATEDPRAGLSSDPNIALTGSASDLSASSSRMTIAVSCEYCGTVNHLPKSLAKTGVLCTRCGKPLVSSSGSSSSGSTSGSLVDSRVSALAGVDRRKHLKRSVEKALEHPEQDAKRQKLSKTLGRREWNDLRLSVESAMESGEPIAIASAIEAIDTMTESQDRRAAEFLAKHADAMPDALRGRGKQALGELKTPDSVNTLLKSLVDDIPELYPFVIRGLGAAGDRRSTRTLVTVGTYWEECTEAAIASLCQLERESVAELISLAERKDKATLRATTLRALGQKGAVEAIPVLTNTLKKDRRPEVRVIAAESLGCIEDRSVLGPLVSALNDKDDSVRVAASEALQTHPRKRIVPALVHVLNDDSPKVRRNAAQLLGRCGVAKAMSPLSLLISDTDPEVRCAALVSLAQLGDDTALPQLAFMLTEARNASDDELAIRVAAELGELQDARAALPLLNAMPGAHPRVQSKIVGSLGQLKDPSVLPALVETMTNGASAAVRSAAVSAIGCLGVPECVEPLKRAVKAGPPLKTPAVAALGGVPCEESAIELVELLCDHSANVRRIAVESLGKVGNEAAVRKLRPLLDDEDEQVREATRNALSQLGIEEPEGSSTSKQAASKKASKRKVRIKKKAARRLKMPEVSWEQLQAIQPSDLIQIAARSPAVLGGLVGVVVLAVALSFYGGKARSFLAGKDSSIVVRGYTSSVSLSGDGSRIAIARDKGVIDLLNKRGGYLLDVRGPILGGVVSNPDGSLIVTGKALAKPSDRSVEEVWNCPWIAPNVARTKVVGLTKDGKVSRIDLESGAKTELGTVPNLQNPTALAIDAEAKQLLIGTKSGNVLIWNAESPDNVFSLAGMTSSVASLSYSSDGQKVVVGGSRGQVFVFEKGNPNPVLELQTQPEDKGAATRRPVTLVKFSGADNITALARKKLHVFSTSDGSRVGSVDVPADERASATADGTVIAVADEEGNYVFMVDVKSGETLWKVPIE